MVKAERLQIEHLRGLHVVLLNENDDYSLVRVSCASLQQPDFMFAPQLKVHQALLVGEQVEPCQSNRGRSRKSQRGVEALLSVVIDHCHVEDHIGGCCRGRPPQHEGLLAAIKVGLSSINDSNGGKWFPAHNVGQHTFQASADGCMLHLDREKLFRRPRLAQTICLCCLFSSQPREVHVIPGGSIKEIGGLGLWGLLLLFVVIILMSKDESPLGFCRLAGGWSRRCKVLAACHPVGAGILIARSPATGHNVLVLVVGDPRHIATTPGTHGELRRWRCRAPGQLHGATLKGILLVAVLFFLEIAIASQVTSHSRTTRGGRVR